MIYEIITPILRTNKWWKIFSNTTLSFYIYMNLMDTVKHALWIRYPSKYSVSTLELEFFKEVPISFMDMEFFEIVHVSFMDLEFFEIVPVSVICPECFKINLVSVINLECFTIVPVSTHSLCNKTMCRQYK